MGEMAERAHISTKLASVRPGKGGLCLLAYRPLTSVEDTLEMFNGDRSIVSSSLTAPEQEMPSLSPSPTCSAPNHLSQMTSQPLQCPSAQASYPCEVTHVSP